MLARAGDDPGVDHPVHRDPGQAAHFQHISPVREALGQIVHAIQTALLEVHGNSVGTGFSDDAVERHHDNSRIAGLLDCAVQCGGRSRIDHDGVVALQDQVLDLRRLFSGLVLRCGERVRPGNDPVLDRLLSGLLPTVEHALAPGVAGIVIGQRDGFVGRVGLGVHEGVISNAVDSKAQRSV